jgi:hypothetical protein
MCLASLNRRSEDVRVLPVIIAELEFGNIQRHIFPAHFVERDCPHAWSTVACG